MIVCARYTDVLDGVLDQSNTWLMTVKSNSLKQDSRLFGGGGGCCRCCCFSASTFNVGIVTKIGSFYIQFSNLKKIFLTFLKDNVHQPNLLFLAAVYYFLISVYNNLFNCSSIGEIWFFPPDN